MNLVFRVLKNYRNDYKFLRPCKILTNLLAATAPYWGPAAIGYLVTTAKVAQPLLVTLAASSKTAVAIAGELAKTAYSKIAIFLEAGMTNTKALMQILLSEGVPREIVLEFIEAAVETHLDEGTVEDFLLYGLVGAGIEIVAGSEVTQKVIKDGAEELLDSVNDIVLSPEARELKRNARKNAKEAIEEHIERTVKTNAKEKWEGGGRDAGHLGFKTNSQSKIDDLRNKMPNNQLSNKGNMAIADVDVEGIKNEFVAHSKIHNSQSRGADIADFSLSKQDKIFVTYVEDKFPRFNDTEAKILEDIASEIRNPNISGTINLYTELDTCQSCTNIIMEFRRKFPNIELNIFTGK